MAPRNKKLSGQMPRVARKDSSKAYKCDQAHCESTGFKYRGSMQRHKKEQHCEIPKCRYCGFTAKRKHQMRTHLEMDHPEQIGDTPNVLKDNYALLTLTLIFNIDTSTSIRRISRSSIRSRCSEDSDSSVLQHTAVLTLQNLQTGPQSFSDYTPTFHSSLEYNSSNSGFIQQAIGTSYSSNTSAALSDGRYGIPLSNLDKHTSTHIAHSPYLTPSQIDPTAWSSNPDTSLGALTVGNRLVTNSFSFSHSANPNLPNQLANSPFSANPYQSASNSGIRYYKSPYSNPSSE